MHCIYVRLATGALLAGVLSACAPISEQQVYEREIRLLEAREDYLARKADCIRMGGLMQIRGRTIASADRFDYKTARCTRR